MLYAYHDFINKFHRNINFNTVSIILLHLLIFNAFISIIYLDQFDYFVIQFN